MRRRRTLSVRLVGGALGLVFILGAGGEAAAQSTASPSVRPQGQVLDRLESAVTRPLSQPPPITSPAPGDSRWVPDHRVRVPGAGEVHVPGHWQHRLPSGDVLVPPVIGRTDDGSPITLPGGRLPSSTWRQGP